MTRRPPNGPPRGDADSPVVVCDTCGKPIGPDDGRYTIADRFDDDDRWVGGRHWKCHEPLDVTLGRLRERISSAEKKLRDLL